MFKIDQFTAANEAAIDQFATLAQISLANIEKFAQIGQAAATSTVLGVANVGPVSRVTRQGIEVFSDVRLPFTRVVLRRRDRQAAGDDAAALTPSRALE